MIKEIVTFNYLNLIDQIALYMVLHDHNQKHWANSDAIHKENIVMAILIPNCFDN